MKPQPSIPQLSPRTEYQARVGTQTALQLVESQAFKEAACAALGQMALAVTPDPFACHKLAGAKMFIEIMATLASPQIPSPRRNFGELEPLEPVPAETNS